MTPNPQNPGAVAGEAAGLFRKKPVVISAVQYTESIRDAYFFDGGALPAGVSIPSFTIHRADRKVWRGDAYIETLEGRMSVSLNDWVITGVQGEHYACKPDIFAATYERASQADGTSGGWQSAPTKPTTEMIAAGMKRMFDEKRYSAPWDDVIDLMYRAMLAAAPSKSQGDNHGE